MSAGTDAVIVRYGEISLKGKNRGHFESLLIRDIRGFLRRSGIGFASIDAPRGRIYIHGVEKTPELEKVFGVYSFSPARELPHDIEALKSALRDLAPELRAHSSFRVSCQRVDKTFPATSIQVEQEMGELLYEATRVPVNLRQPDINVEIEIGPKAIYLFYRRIPGWGGFPYGSAGKLASLLSSGLDSPVATFLMMKRGVEPVLVHFQVSKEDAAKVMRIKEKLEEFSAGNPIRLHIEPRDALFQGRFEELKRTRFAPYLCVICKCLMHRRASEIARREGALGLISGDNLAQVASQTLQNMYAQRSLGDLPVYSPLIAFEKTETMALARRIGIYDLSIVPAPGCVPPDNPKTAVSLERLKQVLSDSGLGWLGDGI
jgi:tRNA uracil 4-sulfurtransferase